MPWGGTPESQEALGYVERTGWNVSAAARRLGVPRHVLAYRLEKYGIQRSG